MLGIRRAQEKDNQEILRILKEADLYYEGLSLENFWVVEKEGKIIGTAQLTEYNDFLFLGSVCVVKEAQAKGVASALLKEVLKEVLKNVYLYTVIPQFFEKFGFKITSPISSLPSKNRYECEHCFSEKCVCMLRRPDAA
jgi:N-acetylglutamate synthase-like GNAT family acetyltransferase